ncbi:hypothetical protein ES708_19451 [subsurface metagenome]
MTTQVFQRGETVPIWAETRNPAGELFNPTPAGIKVTLKKPDGTLAKDYDESDIDGKPMSQTSIGKFVFYYKSAAADPPSWWHYWCEAVDGTSDAAKTVITHGSFELK